MPAPNCKLKIMDYHVSEVHQKPRLTVKDLFVIVIGGIFIFLSVGVNDAFEVGTEWIPKYGGTEVHNFVILLVIVAFPFFTFFLLRRRQKKCNMTDLKRRQAGPEENKEQYRDFIGTFPAGAGEMDFAKRKTSRIFRYRKEELVVMTNDQPEEDDGQRLR